MGCFESRKKRDTDSFSEETVLVHRLNAKKGEITLMHVYRELEHRLEYTDNSIKGGIRSKCSSLLVEDSTHLYISGGILRFENDQSCLSSVLELSIPRNMFNFNSTEREGHKDRKAVKRIRSVQKAQMLLPKFHHAMVQLNSDLVFTIGGAILDATAEIELISDTERFAIHKNIWDVSNLVIFIYF